MGLNFRQIRLRTGELAALEHLEKISIDFPWEKCCDHSSQMPSFFEWIFFIVAGNKDNQRTNGPVNAHLISWPSKAQNIQNLENIW